MKKILMLPLAAAFAITAMAGAATGDAHENKALTAAIEARQAQMKLISYHLGILGDMAKGEIDYDAAQATAAAENLAKVARLDRSLLWLEGSVQGEVPGTRAKADIWSDAAGFEDSATDLETAADGLVTAAGTDLAAIQGAMKAAGSSCGDCHETYRGPRN